MNIIESLKWPRSHFKVDKSRLDKYNNTCSYMIYEYVFIKAAFIYFKMASRPWYMYSASQSRKRDFKRTFFGVSGLYIYEVR